MESLQLFATAQVFTFMLVFARVGTAIMMMPGYGEQSIPPNIRLVMIAVPTRAKTSMKVKTCAVAKS